MIPVLLHIGPITIYSYGLMMALGFLAADLVIALDCKRRGIPREYASTLVVWAAIGGIVGARLLDVINNFPSYMADPKAIIFSGSGFVWYGGLIGGVVTAFFVARYYRVPFLVTADMAGPALALGQGIGRIGCFLSGDGDWGFPSKLPWAVAFHHAIVGWNGRTVLKLGPHDQLVSGFYPGVRVQPTMLYETILYTAVFILLWKLRSRMTIDGRLFYLYLMLAGASRFMVEFIRVNPRILYGLSEAQLIAIVLMVVGAIAWVWSGAHRTEAPADKQAIGA